MTGNRLRLGVAMAVGLALATGCGGSDEPGEARGEAPEPRIVTEGPVDSPERPQDGRQAPAVVLDREEAARWVPRLAVRDLAASLEFYRGLGFAAEGEEPADRVELERNGVRLVLVRAEPTTGETTETDDAAEAAAPVLHLVEDGGGGGREVRDPDGHRLVIPGGG